MKPKKIHMPLTYNIAEAQLQKKQTKMAGINAQSLHHVLSNFNAEFNKRYNGFTDNQLLNAIAKKINE